MDSEFLPDGYIHQTVTRRTMVSHKRSHGKKSKPTEHMKQQLVRHCATKNFFFAIPKLRVALSPGLLKIK